MNLMMVKAWMVILALGANEPALTQVPFGSMEACRAAAAIYTKKLGDQSWHYVYAECAETKFGED